MATIQHLQSATSRFDGSTGPRIIGPNDGKYVDLVSLGVRFMIWGEESGGSVSLVEHPIPARTLVAPLHRHSREDEYSYVLEGRMGAQLGDDVVFAERGDLVFKPRNQWHTFWNAGDLPAGFSRSFHPPASSTISTSGASEWPRPCREPRTFLRATQSSSSPRASRAYAKLTGRYSPERDPHEARVSLARNLKVNSLDRS